MFLQRIVMPSGSVSWTAFDDTGAVVSEIRDFVLFLEARRYATARTPALKPPLSTRPAALGTDMSAKCNPLLHTANPNFTLGKW